MVGGVLPLPGQKFLLIRPARYGKDNMGEIILSPKAAYLDLLESELFNDLLANPGRLESFIPINEVHRLIEKYKYKFILILLANRR